MSMVVEFTHQLGKKFPRAALHPAGIGHLQVDLDHVKADDSGLMTDSTKASYDVAYTCRWTGQRWKCGCRDRACTQSYWPVQSFKR
jgi:hypothetical protein